MTSLVEACLIGLSICAVTDAASCPLSWRLFPPAAWDDAEAATEAAAAAIGAHAARGGNELLAFTGFPVGHWKKIWSTNRWSG